MRASGFHKFQDTIKPGKDGCNLLAVFIEQVGLRIINFFTFAIVARCTDLFEMGTLGLAWTVLYFIEALASGGFNDTYVQHKRSDDITKSTFFWICVTSGTCGFTLMIFAGMFGDLLIKDSDFQQIASFLGAIFLLKKLGGAHQTVLVRAQAHGALAIRTLVASSISAFLGVYFALEGFGIWAILWRNALEAFLRSVFCLFYSFWRPLWCFDIQFAREIVIPALPIVGSSVAKLAIGSTQQIAVSSILGLNVLGGIEVAKRLPVIFQQSSGAVISRFMKPFLSERVRKNLDNAQIILCSLKVGVAVAVIALTAVFFLKESLLGWIFGEQWVTFSDLFFILMVWTTSSIFISFFGSVLTAYGSFKASTVDFVYKLCSFPLFVSLLFYSVNLSYATICAFQAVCAIHMFHLVRKKIRPIK